MGAYKRKAGYQNTLPRLPETVLHSLGRLKSRILF